jgi:hypothetical protein
MLSHIMLAKYTHLPRVSSLIMLTLLSQVELAGYTVVMDCESESIYEALGFLRGHTRKSICSSSVTQG